MEILNSALKFVHEREYEDEKFRRSKYIGISELEYTFKALYALKTLSYL